MTEPLISVVMPVRDGGAWLRAAVDSILQQTWRRLELIVVDDHSTDTALQELDVSDERLSIVGSDGRGVAAAANTGIDRARGAFIARMDADDISYPERLRWQLALLQEQPKLGMVGGRIRMVAADGVRGGNRRYEAWLNRQVHPGDIHKALFIENAIPHPTLMARTDGMRALGGYRTDISWPEDYDLMLRADGQGVRMAKPEPVLLDWRDHDGRLTRAHPAFSLDAFMRCRAHYLARDRLPAVPLVIWGAGKTGKLLHDALQGEGVAAIGFIDIHPRRVGGLKRGLPVWSPAVVAARPDAFFLVAVGAAGARSRIRDFMSEQGREEGSHYLFAS